MSNKPKCVTDSFGNKYWYLNGRFHREDGPAIVYTNGDNVCFKHLIGETKITVLGRKLNELEKTAPWKKCETSLKNGI
ncbi:hypothetical protein CMI47_13285 [Candidatus Pacearchaeota archaeon]|nr:hypothetical protein [Candidatus Pacearchaeota archaeon]|tara:strand:+ start:149 stop:382 length:234 start_codon:yes stop_codon:yes gene_type:complete